MNASELRIGNWVNLLIKNEDGGEVKTRLPLQIKDGRHLDMLFDRDNVSDFIEPIPLTIELPLLNLNLIFDDGCYWFDYGHGMAKVKYVHELQNLFFCLTRQELQLTPSKTIK